MSNQRVNYLLLTNSIIVNFNSKNYPVQKGSQAYDKVLAAVKAGNVDDIPGLVSKEHMLKAYIPNGEFELYEGAVYHKGEKVPGYIGNKLVEFAENNLPYEYLFNFWKRVRKNPSENSRAQLYRFLEKSQCPITQDGTFIAYKAVSPDLKSKHTGYEVKTVSYELNKFATMDRADVEDDPANACGKGLHVGSYEYAKSYACSGDIIIEVEVDPIDVVSVPNDADSGKLRGCRIKPIHLCKAQYDTITVASDKGAKTDKVAADGAFIINRKRYDFMDITASQYAEILQNTHISALTRIKPSKMPKSIREKHTVTVGYRFMSDKKVPVYMAETESGRILWYPENNVPSNIIASELYDVKSVVATVMISRKQHDVIVITEEQYNGYDVNEFINVRASKRPVAIKHMFPNATKCKRLIIKSSSQYLVVDNDKYYQFIESDDKA